MLRKKQEPTGLEAAIDEVLREMKGFESDSDTYAVMIDQLVKLHAMKEAEKPPKVSRDTILIVAGNLVGIVLILSYEKTNVLTTKALQFLLKKGTF